ncbi:MAG: hypothetical protein J6Q39_04930 [Bacteroidales bacterium]|nr:hypothetical protein [Bacteroidales bacterium]
MKTKLLLILLAVFMPLSAFVLNADEPPHKQEIPLHLINNGSQDKDNRSLIQHSIECHYLSMMNAVVTTVWADLGDVNLTVTNCSTGNVWYDSFDSALEPQTMLTLSGEPGTYQIIYITESGDIYEGILNIE